MKFSLSNIRKENHRWNFGKMYFEKKCFEIDKHEGQLHMASQEIFYLLENYSFTFDQDIPDRLKCILCDQILINTKQTSCGCRVCEKCINEYLKDGEMPCPGKQPDCAKTKLMLNRDINHDIATNREISNLKAKCPFNSCTVKELLNMMQIHIDSCEHGKATCDKCSKMYPYKNKSKHDQSECDKRIMICIHCQKLMTAQTLNDAHLNVDHKDLCSQYIGDCNNGCGKKSVNLKNHLRNCTKGQVILVDLLAHHQTESVHHFSSLLAERNALIDLKKKDLEGATSSQETYVVYCNGSFIWKITDYDSLKRDAENNGKASITSNCFYISEFGYKMCLKIYPAGISIGRKTHLSVFFAIMKGDFDDSLTWPFMHEVTLSLLDQEKNGATNYSTTVWPDARSECYQKPVTDCNSVSGSTKFISLTRLIPNSIYYKNDSLFLKIAINTTEI